jgi:hypothetical protein
MASEQIRHAQTPDGDWVYLPSPTGDHITLPLDPALFDDAAVEAAAKALCESEGLSDWEQSTHWYRNSARAALAGYAAHVAGVRDE